MKVEDANGSTVNTLVLSMAARVITGLLVVVLASGAIAAFGALIEVQQIGQHVQRLQGDFDKALVLIQDNRDQLIGQEHFDARMNTLEQRVDELRNTRRHEP